MKWIDTTSYSKGEKKGVAAVRTWSLGEDHTSAVLVHRIHGVTGSWFLTCYDLGIKQCELSNDLVTAKIEALGHVCTKLKSLVAYYKKLGVEL